MESQPDVSGPTILLVEDSPEDLRILRRALKRAGMDFPILHFEQGEDALRFLQRQSPAEDRPSLIMLDVNLPGIDGLEILRLLKADDRLQQIPVIMLTTTVDEHEVLECYRLGANSFIRKPLEFDQFVEQMRRMHAFWFGLATLPQE
ncbi:Response regulator [Sulfidibacter corallicola]|nr:response regulator [Sulfidibacter corallicola]